MSQGWRGLAKKLQKYKNLIYIMSLIYIWIKNMFEVYSDEKGTELMFEHDQNLDTNYISSTILYLYEFILKNICRTFDYFIF